MAKEKSSTNHQIVEVKKQVEESVVVMDFESFDEKLRNRIINNAFDQKCLEAMQRFGVMVIDTFANGTYQVGPNFKKTEICQILMNDELRQDYINKLYDIEELLRTKYESGTRKLIAIPAPTKAKKTGDTWSVYYGGYEKDSGSPVRYETKPKMLEQYTTNIVVSYVVGANRRSLQGSNAKIVLAFLQRVILMRTIAEEINKQQQVGQDGYQRVMNVLLKTNDDGETYYSVLTDPDSLGYRPISVLNIDGSRRIVTHPDTKVLQKNMVAIVKKLPNLTQDARKNTQFGTYYWPRDAELNILDIAIGDNFILLESETIGNMAVAAYMDLLGNIGIGQVVSDSKFIQNGNADESVRSLAARQAPQLCFSSFVPIKYSEENTSDGKVETGSEVYQFLTFKNNFEITKQLLNKVPTKGMTGKCLVDPYSGSVIPFLSEAHLSNALDSMNRSSLLDSYVRGTIEDKPPKLPARLPIIEEVEEMEEVKKMEDVKKMEEE